MIIQLLSTFTLPLWGDDYIFLEAAKQARVNDEPWWLPLFNPEPDKFWRPLGEDITWRFIETVTNEHWLVGRLVSISVFVAATMALAWALTLSLTMLWPVLAARQAATIAALLFAIHPAQWMQLTWTSAINGLWVLLFAALTFAFTIKSWHANDSTRWRWSIAAMIMFILSLLCKEIAIVIPVLIGILYLWAKPSATSNKALISFVLFTAMITVIWLYLRSSHVIADTAYSLSLGLHSFRNGVLYIGYALAIPREVLRVAIETGNICSWSSLMIPIVLQAAAIAIAFKAAWPRLQIRGLFFLTVFSVVACAPYFFLQRPGYAYYITLALFAYAILMAVAAQTRYIKSIIVLSLSASFVAVIAENTLSGNTLYKRVRQGEAHLIALEEMHKTNPAPFAKPMQIIVDDFDDFYPISVYGMSYRLGARADQMLITRQCGLPGNALVLKAGAAPYWKKCDSQKSLIKASEQIQ